MRIDRNAQRAQTSVTITRDDEIIDHQQTSVWLRNLSIKPPVFH